MRTIVICYYMDTLAIVSLKINSHMAHPECTVLCYNSHDNTIYEVKNEVRQWQFHRRHKYYIIPKQ